MLTPSKSLLRVQVYFPKPENFGAKALVVG